MSHLPSFHVRNLGPIEEGTVQLHPLTILIGKNNTGKTYMAQAIYAAYKALERANGPVQPSIALDEFEDLMDRIHGSATSDADLLSDPLRNKAENWMRSKLDRVGQQLENRLTVYYDLDDLAELERWGSSGSLQISVTADGATADSTFLFGLNSDAVSGIRLAQLTVGDSQDSRTFDLLRDLLVSERLTGHEEVSGRRASSLLAEFLWEEHMLPAIGLDGVAHYLPAGRSGLLEAWTDVVRLRLERDREGLALTGRESAALGGIALDFLLKLQELIRPSTRRYRGIPSRRPKRTPPLHLKAAALHLEALIDGGVELARGRERVPSLTYTQGSQSIPVQRASSMVAELAPLLSWINHLLRSGDLLLIDEPEAHMHPEAVLAVAQTLVALSRSGVRVLCTTHSSEFLHQVSNCMLRAESPTNSLPSEAPTINATDIGVYRFERPNRSTGTIVVPVVIDPKWGIPEDEHVTIAEQLADETATLVDRLK